MAGVLQHLRSSTLDKRPNPGSMVDGQVAINYASGSPGMFFKDSNGDLVKVGPVHVGGTAPNVSPASGGTAGNSIGEQWLDTSGGTYVFKVWDGSAWRSEAGEFVNVTGDTMTGTLTIGSGATIAFEGATDDGFETTLTVVDPTADRTITLPDVDGTVVTTGDSGTVTSTMIADGTIVNADVNASAAIAGTKISPDFGSQNVVTTGTSTAASFIPTSSTVPTNGVYLPAANSVALSTNGTGRLQISETGNLYLYTGHAYLGNNYRLYFRNSTNTAYASALHIGADNNLYVNDNSENNAIIFRNGSGERLRITSAGLVGIGTSSPSYPLDVIGDGGITSSASTNSTSGLISVIGKNSSGSTSAIGRIRSYPDGSGNTSQLAFETRNSSATMVEAMRIDSSQRVGIGTSSPSAPLNVETSTDGPQTLLFLRNTNASGTNDTCRINLGVLGTAGTGTCSIWAGKDSDHSTAANVDTHLAFSTTLNDLEAERARIDSSGRLLVGTSSAVGGYTLQIEQNAGSNPFEGSILLKRGVSNASIGANYYLGSISAGSQTNVGGFIRFESDAGWGTDDYPTRLTFSSTPSGSATPVERMRITSGGEVFIGKTADTATANGVAITDPSGDCTLSLVHNSASSGHRLLVLNRQNSDGTLAEFYHANTLEGSISVSGTTVTYGGGHLARWSQLPDNENPSQLLKGTVMSNLDEMCEWDEEDNEQLNKTKISDVEGDKNVAGVFVSTSFSEDGPLDFFVGMTGDMVIRIAQGVTVERGDLLMSAGDGTAKPQDDDIIRSKTIAKVTSTNVSCTYDDGSYCVPCVLMAC